MFGVISCPKCKRVTGADLKYKTKKCGRCSYTMKLNKVRIWTKTSDSKDLPELIKNITMEITKPSIKPLDY